MVMHTTETLAGRLATGARFFFSKVCLTFAVATVSSATVLALTLFAH
jgi:hypothetical protein